MAKQAFAREVDVEPIDRLEEKISLLVNMITRLRAEQAKAAEENMRLAQQVETLRAQLLDAQGAGHELRSLREERDVIRGRVSDMLQQLESLNV